MKKIILCMAVLVSVIFMGKVKAYSEYEIGDTITLNNEEYYVIQKSSSTDDSLVLLKANPLTVSEINKYGSGHINAYSRVEAFKNTVSDLGDGTGGVAFYNSNTCRLHTYTAASGDTDEQYKYSTSSGEVAVGIDVSTLCKSDYASSDVKAIVDAWAKGTFKDGVQARLLKLEDLYRLGYAESLTDIPNNSYKMHEALDNVYEWVYSDTYDYWITDVYESSTKEVYSIWNSSNTLVNGKTFATSHHVAYPKGAIRPVVSINKSAVEASDADSSSKDSDNSDNVKVADTLLQKSLVGTIIGLVLIGMGVSVYLITLKKSKK